MGERPPRVTMSERRRQSIYDAVHHEITNVRIEIAQKWRGNRAATEADAMISKAGHRAAMAAIRAALPKGADDVE